MKKGEKSNTYVLSFFFFLFPMRFFFLLGSFLVNKIFVRMLSSLKKLELGINKLFFSVKKPITLQKNRLAAIETFLIENLPAALLLNQFGTERSPWLVNKSSLSKQFTQW